jgi:hypothetical protein
MNCRRYINRAIVERRADGYRAVIEYLVESGIVEATATKSARATAEQYYEDVSIVLDALLQQDHELRVTESVLQTHIRMERDTTNKLADTEKELADTKELLEQAKRAAAGYLAKAAGLMRAGS